MNQGVAHYRLFERLGTGGMGTVYRAEDTRNGRVVAVKVLHPHLAGDRSYVRRYRREAQIARRLNSPNIVRVLDAGQDGDTWFIVQEFVDGESLARRLAARGRLSIEETTALGDQVATALAEAERHGIVHRDISPQNILLDRIGVAKVADFGIARDLSETLTATSFVGKPHYASPDQWSGRVDIRSDIYSLGVVLFHALAGVVPFNDATPLGTMRMHEERPPPALRGLRPEVPEALAAVVHRCLAKRPEDRYQAPSELMFAIRLAQRSSAPEPFSVERTTDGRARWPFTLAGLVGAIAAITIVTLTIVGTTRGEHSTRKPSASTASSPQYAESNSSPGGEYPVEAGDTPELIATRLEIPDARRSDWLAQFTTLNRLGESALKMGQVLKLPASVPIPADSSTAGSLLDCVVVPSAPLNERCRTYLVEPGDTPEMIAAKLRIPQASRPNWISQLFAINELDQRGPRIGQLLKLPAGSP